MTPRPLMIATLVGASVGVPYFASHAQKGQGSAASPIPTVGDGLAATATPSALSTSATAPMLLPISTPTAYPLTKPANDTPITPVAQVLRFDVTKQWVDQTWPRKTVAPTDVGLTSVRVPLVSGTQPSSLAGSLTYFFNPQGQVEHISFRGRTGNAAPLIQLLTQQYHLQRVDTGIGDQVYQVRSGDGVQSELRIQTSGVLRSDAPQQNVTVELELARPGSQRYLPPREPALQIPHVEPSTSTTPPAQNAGGGMTDSVKAAASNYWDQIHYATPEEKAPSLWNRWPD